MYYPLYRQRTEYRLPGVRWSNQQQQWILTRNTVASRGVTIEHLDIDPAQLPRPCYFPGQRVAFRDSRGTTHEGMIESVGCYGCTYQDPSEGDYWYQWAYLGQRAYTYFVRLSIPTECYQIYAEAILCVLPPRLPSM